MVNYMDGRVIERYQDEMLFDGNPVNKIMNSNDLYKKYSNSTYGNLYNVANTDKGKYYSFLQNMMLQ